MESNMGMQAAMVLLGIGTLSGSVMAGIRFRGIPRPPFRLALFHSTLAAAGLTLLIYAAFTVDIPLLAQLALGFLVVAVVGGMFANLQFHANALPLPASMIIGHAAIAVVGFVMLLVSALKLA